MNLIKKIMLCLFAFWLGYVVGRKVGTPMEWDWETYTDYLYSNNTLE